MILRSTPDIVETFLSSFEIGEMDIPGITWQGESIEDIEILRDLPDDLRRLLNERNGFIVHEGAVHVRGACVKPAWHSLHAAWRGSCSFSSLYHDVKDADIPFAQDQFGDQFLIREGAILRLSAETGEIEAFVDNLESFLSALRGDIEESFNVGLNHRMQPGQLLHAFPPFCFEEAGAATSLRPVPASEVILFHADLARQIRDVPDGGRIEFKMTE